MDLSRDIGSLEARMDDHDRRFDKLEEMVTAGFDETKAGLAELRSSESRRKGAMGVIKLIFGAGGFAGLYEVIKGLLHR
jgi:hypothetical protein